MRRRCLGAILSEMPLVRHLKTVNKRALQTMGFTYSTARPRQRAELARSCMEIASDCRSITCTWTQTQDPDLISVNGNLQIWSLVSDSNHVYPRATENLMPHHPALFPILISHRAMGLQTERRESSCATAFGQRTRIDNQN